MTDSKQVTNPLLVPVHLDALVIYNDTDSLGLWKNLGQKLTMLYPTQFTSTGFLGHSLYVSPQEKSETKTYLKKGIHLHWTLPNWFRKGRYEMDVDPDGNFINKKTGGQQLQFPKVPNRWLIVRLQGNESTRAWIIESDQQTPKTPKGNAPIPNYIREQEGSVAANIFPEALGRVQSLEGWKEPGEEPFLTIISPGNPEFAASYMHSGRIFGFHDEMKDLQEKPLENGKFSYFLAGWFSDPLADPLYGISDATAFIKQMDDMGWAIDAISDNTKPANQIFCHSFLDSVEWGPMSTSHLPQPASLRVAIGYSPSEALAALIFEQRYLPGTTNDPLLAAFQYKLIKERGFPTANGPAQAKRSLGDKLHARGFQPVKSGIEWVIVPAQNKNLTEDNKQIDFLPPFPIEVAKALILLNKEQQDQHKVWKEWYSVQEDLYAYGYLQRYSSNLAQDDYLYKQGDNITIRINDLKNQLTELNEKVQLFENEGTDSLANLRKQLQDALITSNDPVLSKCVVEKKEAQPYVEPVDPSVIIDGLYPDPRYFNKDPTACRYIDQLPNEITIDQSPFDRNHLPSSVETPVNKIASQLPEWPFLINLLTECFLYSRLFIDEFKQSTTSGWTPLQVKNLGKAIESPWEYKYAFVRDGQVAKLPPSYAARQWNQPWIPLYLEWEAVWEGTEDSNSAESLKQWTVGTNTGTVDFNLNLDAKTAVNRELAGRVVLSYDTNQKAKDFFTLMKGYKNGLDEVDVPTPLSQSLSGFNSQLINRCIGESLLPILTRKRTIDDKFGLIQHFRWRPNLNLDASQPLRAGRFWIKTLRIVDAFGQVVDVLNEKSAIYPQSLSIASSLQTQPSDKPIQPTGKCPPIIMPPRILQPARLKIEGLAANVQNSMEDRPADADPGSSPICGWLLSSRVGRIIQVFNGAGIELGEIHRGRFRPLDSTQENELKTVGEQIVKDVIEFLKNANNYDLLTKRIASQQEQIQVGNGRENLNMELPVGVPIAIVRTSIQLELHGTPYKDLIGQLQNESISAKLPAIPVRIGEEGDPRDGLVGYFNMNYPLELFLPARNKESPTVLLAPGESQKLIFLMDARAPVNLSCGILPIQKFELSRYLIESPLKSIALRFLVAPILTPKNRISFPLLQSREFSWSILPPEETERPESSKSGPPKMDKKESVNGSEQLESTNAGFKFEPLRLIEKWVKLEKKRKS